MRQRSSRPRTCSTSRWTPPVTYGGTRPDHPLRSGFRRRSAVAGPPDGNPEQPQGTDGDQRHHRSGRGRHGNPAVCGGAELLLNVVKHAQVDSARLQIDRLDGDMVRIVVSDDGRGLSRTDSWPGRLQAPGWGCRLAAETGVRRRAMRNGQRSRTRYPCHAVGQGGRPAKSPTSAAAASRGEQSGCPVPGSGATPGEDRLPSSITTPGAEGLKEILNAEADIEVVAEACSGEQAIDLARRHRPHVVVWT